MMQSCSPSECAKKGRRGGREPRERTGVEYQQNGERGRETTRVGAPAGDGGDRIRGRPQKGNEQSERDSGPRQGPKRKPCRCLQVAPVAPVGSRRGVGSGRGDGGEEERSVS